MKILSANYDLDENPEYIDLFKLGLVNFINMCYNCDN